MKNAIWIFSVVALCGIALWIVTGNALVGGDTFSVFVALFFLVPSLGVFWMLYAAIRYEPKPLTYAALAFVPFAFLWYYFERYRVRFLADKMHGNSGA